MARPAISTERLSDTLTLSECHKCGEHPHGYRLYEHRHCTIDWYAI
jgi:hypothetical protein